MTTGSEWVLAPAELYALALKFADIVGKAALLHGVNDWVGAAGCAGRVTGLGAVEVGT